jgi:hypothetical protein
MPVMLVIVESGAIYSATLTTLIATYLAGSEVQYIVVDMVREVISANGGGESDCIIVQISSMVVCSKM